MSLPGLWAFLAVGLPMLAAVIANLPSVDLTYHLRAGAEILAGSGIPTHDTWTFTAAGLPWIDQQWGAQVVLSGVYQVAGWTGLVLFRALLIGGIFGCLLLIGIRAGLGFRRASWLALAAFLVSAVALGLRPQLLGMALFALVLLLVTDRRAHPGRLWAVPVIVLIWANIHGSFFLGPLVLGLAWLEDVHDGAAAGHRTFRIGLVSALAACVTPFGPLVWGYAVGLSTNSEVTSRITEWQPTTLATIPGMAFFASGLAIAVLIARRGRVVPWPTLAWFAVFFVIGVIAIRGVAWWPLGAVAAIAGMLARAPAASPAALRPAISGRPDTARAEPPGDQPLRGQAPGSVGMRRINLAVAAAIVVVGAVLLPVWRPIDPGLGAPSGIVGIAPPGITAALRERAGPTDRVLNPQLWGSWFEFALPTVPIAIDSRIELFPPAVWTTYETIVGGRDGWEEWLQAWGVTIVVLEADNTAFADRLASAGWTTIYSDAAGSIVTPPTETVP